MNDIDQTIYGFGVGLILCSLLVVYYGYLSLALFIAVVGWIITVSRFVYNIWRFDKIGLK